MRQKLQLINADLSLKFLIVGINLLFLHDVLMSLAVIYMSICYAGFIFLFLSLLTAIAEEKIRYLEYKYSCWIVILLIYALFMLLHGMILGNGLRYISRDVWPFCFFACLLVSAKKENWFIIDKMIYFQFTFSLLLVVFIWIFFYGFNISRQIIMHRSDTWESARLAWAWGLLYGWQYMFFTYRNSNNLRRMITILGAAIFFLFALIYEKRMPFIILGLFAFFYIYFNNKIRSIDNVVPKKLRDKIVSLILVLILLGAGSLIIAKSQQITGNSYVNKLLERFEEGGSIINMVLNNPRIDRIPKSIVGKAEKYQLVIGQGLGSTIFWNSNHIDTVESGVMHLFLKGGIIFSIIWYFAMFLIICDLFFNKTREKIKFQILASIVIIISPLAPIFNMNFLIGYYMLWFGRSMARPDSCR